MKNIIVSMQEVQQYGDVGNHDPVASSIEDEEFEYINALGDTILIEDKNKIDFMLMFGTEVTLPATIDGMFNFWYESK